MKDHPKLSRLERVPLREAWKHEANDFTPWLAEAENLNQLADALGLYELEKVATEHWVGDFKLDILCSDGEDPVIIENQLDKTNHAHLGQLIAYAAGVGAKKVVWVAETFRPEHAAALEFLNENTTEDLVFFAVEIELWRIGDSPLAPKFEVVVKPNDWIRSGREQARRVTDTTPTKTLQLNFWTALVGELAKRAPQIRPQKPRPQHWLNNSIGRSGFGLIVTANTQKSKLGVELWMPDASAKQHFANLLKQKDLIEQSLGFELDWQELEDSQASRIAAWLPNAVLEDETQWKHHFDWIIDRLVRMDKVLRPIVKALP